MAALEAAGTVGCVLDPPEMARVPKGYAAADWDHLLRRKSLIVRTSEDLPPPDWLFTGEAIGRVAGILRALLPVVTWLKG